ncbi:MAG TPA: endo-1,4-beta-xylanase [Bacteroidales bacterium]|jgi:endo-1,4-beta-xylanase|nr:endo-1,4-beta-xylanase [Bacteroidales bacterium]
MKKIFFPFLILVLIGLHSCAQKQSGSLKQAYAPYFKIGTALNASHIEEGDYDGVLLVRKHFNAITPENVMKWELIHPSPTQYNFALPDAFVKFGQRDSMFMVGHTLVWHSQLPQWVQSITDPVQLEQVMKEHIFQVMGRYKGKIHAWDVVNEALNEDGSMRESVFYKVLGPNYIAKAFTYAHQADPNCKLYYNDYNMVVPAKRQGAIRIIKELQAQGIPIHGVGMQGHWNLNWPSLQDIEQAITDFAALGITVMVTELDITVLPNPWDLVGADVNQQFQNSEKMNPYPNFLPDSVDIQLAKRYEDIFKIFIKHHTVIDRVSFWGVHDGVSWLNDWPIHGRTNYPLLFNRNYKPKRAFKTVMAVAKLQETK